MSTALVARRPTVEYLDPVGAAMPAPPPRGGALELLSMVRELNAATIEADEAVRQIVSRAQDLLQTDLAWGGTVEDGQMRLRHVFGARTEALTSVIDERTPLEMALSGAALQRQRTLIVSDYPRYEYATTYGIRRGMRSERVASMMVAPMFRGRRLVGYVNVANRRPTAFGPAHSALLSALAAQGSVTILNANLQAELRGRNQLLSDSLAIQRELTAVTLGDGGAENLLTSLEGRLGRRVEFLAEGAPHRAQGRLRIPVLAAGDLLGWLLVDGGDLAPLELHALNHGAAALALELLKLRAADEAEHEMRARTLEEMVEPGLRGNDSLPQRLQHLGHAGDPRLRLLAVESLRESPGASALHQLVRRHLEREAKGLESPAALTYRKGETVVAAVGGEHEPARLHEHLGKLGCEVAIGVSRLRGDLAGSRAEAAACLGFARRARASVVLDASRLGALRFLLDVPDLALLSAFVRDRLSTLVEADLTSRASLLETARAFVELDGRRRLVAERCVIHLNTLKYRLARIEDEVGCSLRSHEERFALRLAFDVNDLLAQVRIDPFAS